MKYLLGIILCLSAKLVSAQGDMPSVQDIRNEIAGEIKSFNIPPEAVAKVENKAIATSNGLVKIRIYYSTITGKHPIIYNIHGGALVAGDLDTHDNICRILANRTGATVVALDYPMPPEHPYPAGLDACYDVLKWIVTHAAELRGADNDITLLGDSGGGLFASALQVKLLQQKSAVKFKKMVLINPAEDLRNPGEGLYGLVTNWYLAGKDPNDPLVSPILNKDFSKFPPTLIVVCGKDELKPHGVAMYDKLKLAGVKTALVEIPEEGHLGGLWAAGHPKAKVAIDAAVAFVK